MMVDMKQERIPMESVVDACDGSFFFTGALINRNRHVQILLQILVGFTFYFFVCLRNFGMLDDTGIINNARMICNSD